MAKLESMPLSWFKVNPQARRTFNDAELRSLGESLKVKQLHPVIAFADGTIICGERRFRGASLVGKTHLLAEIVENDLSATEVRVLQIAENIHRSDLTGYEKWMACCELMTINTDWTAKDLAESLKLDPSSATRLLSPSKTIAAAQDALREGKIGISDCYAISKARTPAEQAEMLAMKLSGASRDAIEQMGRSARNGDATTVRAARIKCVMPSGLCITLSGQELSLASAADALADAHKAVRKAIAEGLNAQTFQAVMRDKAKTG